MALAFRAVGTVSQVASGNLTPGLPAGHTTNDILALFVGQSDNVNSTLGTWTQKLNVTNGTLARAQIYLLRDNGSVSAPTVTHTAGAVATAFICAYSGVDPSLDITGTGTGGVLRDIQSQGSTDTTNPFTVTAPALTGVIANDLLGFFGLATVANTNDNFAWGVVSGFSERLDNANNLGGNDVGVANDDKVATGSAGSITSSVNYAGGGTFNWIGCQFALNSDSGVVSYPLWLPHRMPLGV